MLQLIRFVTNSAKIPLLECVDLPIVPKPERPIEMEGMHHAGPHQLFEARGPRRKTGCPTQATSVGHRNLLLRKTDEGTCATNLRRLHARVQRPSRKVCHTTSHATRVTKECQTDGAQLGPMFFCILNPPLPCPSSPRRSHPKSPDRRWSPASARARGRRSS